MPSLAQFITWIVMGLLGGSLAGLIILGSVEPAFWLVETLTPALVQRRLSALRQSAA